MDDLKARDVSPIYIRDIEDLFLAHVAALNLIKRTGGGDRSQSGSAGHSKSTGRENSPSRGGSVSRGNSHGGSPGTSSTDSMGSTESSRLVGLSKLKTSKEKSVTVSGVNGCTALMLQGECFVTGAHLHPEKSLEETQAAAREAQSHGTVHSVHIKSPDAPTTKGVKDEVKKTFPKAKYTISEYKLDFKKGAGYHEVVAHPGNRKVQEKYIPPSRGPSPESSVSPGQSPPHPKKKARH